MTDWHLEGPGTLNIMNGQLCVSGWTAGAGPPAASLVGWSSQGSPVMFSAGTSYRMSYQTTPSGSGITMHVKVGLSVPPYTGRLR